MHNDNVTYLVFIDFKNAFDVLNCEMLLKELELYGINKTSLKMVQLLYYLTKRKQFVNMDSCTSSQLYIKQGVRQCLQ
jgi:hypothetical protein